MKATGIVRRIDELGRVVIPKEIRRTLRIKDGDPLEIFTERDELMLQVMALDVHHLDGALVELILLFLARPQRIEDGVLAAQGIAVVHPEEHEERDDIVADEDGAPGKEVVRPGALLVVLHEIHDGGQNERDEDHHKALFAESPADILELSDAQKIAEDVDADIEHRLHEERQNFQNAHFPAEEPRKEDGDGIGKVLHGDRRDAAEEPVP